MKLLYDNLFYYSTLELSELQELEYYYTITESWYLLEIVQLFIRAFLQTENNNEIVMKFIGN